MVTTHDNEGKKNVYSLAIFFLLLFREKLFDEPPET